LIDFAQVFIYGLNPINKNYLTKGDCILTLTAKKRVSSGFTWDDYGGKIIKEYERILEKDDKD